MKDEWKWKSIVKNFLLWHTKWKGFFFSYIARDHNLIGCDKEMEPALLLCKWKDKYYNFLISLLWAIKYFFVMLDSIFVLHLYLMWWVFWGIKFIFNLKWILCLDKLVWNVSRVGFDAFELGYNFAIFYQITQNAKCLNCEISSNHWNENFSKSSNSYPLNLKLAIQLNSISPVITTYSKQISTKIPQKIDLIQSNSWKNNFHAYSHKHLSSPLFPINWASIPWMYLKNERIFYWY